MREGASLFDDDRVTREDLRFYRKSHKEERTILQALELTPEDVTGIGLVEKIWNCCTCWVSC